MANNPHNERVLPAGLPEIGYHTRESLRARTNAQMPGVLAAERIGTAPSMHGTAPVVHGEGHRLAQAQALVVAAEEVVP